LEFEPSELLYVSSDYEGTPVNGTILVDAMQTPGTYRMRVASFWVGEIPSPCAYLPSGSFVDFNITVIPSASCTEVTTLNISNTTFTSVDISWTAGGSETLWDIQWGTGTFNPNTNTGTDLGSQNGLTTTNYSITGLTPETDYKIYVRADCGNGDASFWSSVGFRTGYCVPAGLVVNSFYWISSFTTTGADTNLSYSTSSGVSYANQTTAPLLVSQGESFNWSVSTSLGSYIYVWVNWNGNMEFEPSERIYASTVSQTSVTGTILANQPPGTYRIRVTNSFYQDNALSPC